jgi:hypothetical protein
MGQAGDHWGEQCALGAWRRRSTTLAWRAFATACALSLAACGVGGSGKAGSETRTVPEFTEIEVSGALELRLGLQKPQSVVLGGDDNLLPLVTTDVTGKRLVIGSKQSLRPELDLVATVAAEDVSLVRCSGACKVTVTDLKNERFTLEVSGAGSLDASGETKELRIDVSGAGSVAAEKLAASSVTVRTSGAGDVAVGKADKLDVEISGAGSVSYQGDPAITKKISGAGSLTRK